MLLTSGSIRTSQTATPQYDINLQNLQNQLGVLPATVRTQTTVRFDVIFCNYLFYGFFKAPSSPQSNTTPPEFPQAPLQDGKVSLFFNM